MNVVLPAPFGPISPTSRPGPTSRSTSTTAWTPPKLTEIPVAARTGVIGCPSPGSARRGGDGRPQRLAPELVRRAAVLGAEHAGEVLRAGQAPAAGDREDRLVRQRRVGE